MSLTKSVLIYTDGACSGNPGPGGLGAVLLHKAHRKEISRGFRWTTNNRMELWGLIAALEALREPCRAEIVSDSKYVLDPFQKKWLTNWKRNGWLTKARQPVLNRDLWERLDALAGRHEVNFVWVKGHATTAENNVCDQLAVAACRCENPEIDAGYERTNPFKG